jgi:phage gp45-like
VTRDPSWVVLFSRVAATSASGHEDEVDGRSEPDEPSYQVQVRRLFPFGLRSRPPAGVDAVAVCASGSPSAGVMVGAESPAYGPSDLAEGEAALYNIATGTRVLLKADGSIQIDAASGKDVVVNGGTARVSRVGDSVTVTGTCPNTGTGTPVAITASGTIAAGAARFKA